MKEDKAESAPMSAQELGEIGQALASVAAARDRLTEFRALSQEERAEYEPTWAGKLMGYVSYEERNLGLIFAQHGRPLLSMVGAHAGIGADGVDWERPRPMALMNAVYESVTTVDPPVEERRALLNTILCAAYSLCADKDIPVPTLEGIGMELVEARHELAQERARWSLLRVRLAEKREEARIEWAQAQSAGWMAEEKGRKRAYEDAIALQDGATPADVRALKVKPAALCVGGSTTPDGKAGWKWDTAPMWPQEFPDLYLHLLRCNSPEKLKALERWGYDSCDGTGWNRGDANQTRGLTEFCLSRGKPLSLKPHDLFGKRRPVKNSGQGCIL